MTEEMHEPVVPKRKREKREQESPAVQPVVQPTEKPAVRPLPTPVEPSRHPDVVPVGGITASWNGFKVATTVEPGCWSCDNPQAQGTFNGKTHCLPGKGCLAIAEEGACPHCNKSFHGVRVCPPGGCGVPFNQASRKIADALGNTMMGENFPGSSGGKPMTGQIDSAPVSVTDAANGQGITPGEGSTTITSSWKSSDYLNTIKQGSDSDIYFRGMSDGRAGKEMDETLAALSDDYFNGWQDGQVYKHAPTEETPPRLLDMNPGNNNIPPIYANLNPEKLPASKKKKKSSIDRECIECGSIKIAHCGEPGCPDEEGHEKGKVGDANTFNMQIAGSVHYCKNCMNTGIVCGGCGSPKIAGSLDDDDSADEVDNDFISGPYGRDNDEPHDEDCDCDSCFLGQYDDVQDDDEEYEGDDEGDDKDHDDEDHSDMSDEHYNQD